MPPQSNSNRGELSLEGVDKDVGSCFNRVYRCEDDLDELRTAAKEAAKLTKVGKVNVSGNDDGIKSPVPQRSANDNTKAKPVKFAGGNEKGGKGPSPKSMNVKGPQDQGGKLTTKVSKPSNSSTKSKSVMGS